MHGPRCRNAAPWPVHDQGGRDGLAIMRFGLELFLPKAYPIKCAKVPKKIHLTFTTSCLSSLGKIRSSPALCDENAFSSIPYFVA